MTDQHIPTTKDTAPARCHAPLTAPPAEPGPAATAPAFDRVRWEQALMSSDTHGLVRLVGFTLAHFALGGRLPADSVQHSTRMGRLTGLSQERVRASLRDLEKHQLISRPPVEAWASRDVPRPITLTVPGNARTQPPSPGAPR